MSACARLISSAAAVMFMATALGAAQGDAAATAAKKTGEAATAVAKETTEVAKKTGSATTKGAETTAGGAKKLGLGIKNAVTGDKKSSGDRDK